MQILMLATIYPATVDGSPYLTSELAEAWQKAGHQVDVVVLQWASSGSSEPSSLVFPSGVKVHYFHPPKVSQFGRLVERLMRWGLSSWLLRSAVRKTVGRKHYDMVFTYSPLTAIGSLAHHFTRCPGTYSCVYVVDFFPIAHRDIGLIPSGPLFSLAKWRESALLNRFDAIACMSPANITFLKRNYSINPKIRIFERRIWGEPPLTAVPERHVVRHRYGLDLDAKLALFGGQLVEGRGLEDIIGAARLARAEGSDVQFLVLGDGRLRAMVEQEAMSGGSNLVYRLPVARDDYLALASACDVGLVVTVRNTKVPTFPSKCIDYLRAGIPIAAATEEATDFGAFVEHHSVGRATIAGNPQDLLDCVNSVLNSVEDRSTVQQRCWQVSATHFNVHQAAQEILNSIDA